MEDQLKFVLEKLLLRTETLDDIAEKAGVSRRTLGYIIEGRDDIRLLTLNKLVTHFTSKKDKKPR